MCEPTTLAIAGLAISAIGTGVAYDQQRQAGKANAQIAENNAKLAADDARNEMALGDRETQHQAWRTRALEGQQRAAIAAQGIDASIGTPLDILGETAMFGEIDQQAIRLNTARRAWGFNAQAQNTRNQSGVDRYNTRQQGYGTILGGLSSGASGYAAIRSGA